MRPKVYIDGREGTTGLQIYERLAARRDIELLTIGGDKRKDPAERAERMDRADIVFLCLPDAAAVEAVGLVTDPDTRIVDCSTAHRTAAGWAYGFPELSAAHRSAVRDAKRVANPGCHATGFLAIVYPLVALGILPRDAALSCFSLTGYSGGGKKMIAQYEQEDRAPELSSPALYGLRQDHKHLPEMQKVCGLETPPVFVPIVDDYYKGMAGTVPFRMDQLRGPSTLGEVRQALRGYYAETAGTAGIVRVADVPADGAGAGSKIYADALAGKDALTLIAAGNDERFTITALFDNLGKGASGAAVQNMNIMLGLDEAAGLDL
ncbi:N-acetyl-gamma-glutamyl-phosphate reductase [uncultured Oscillibacter sp.]|uniref:N-acetyl-gamma-glutamyl-phosphate reductase n=1 Tax=uncultured Oscillibacter sp. TaxID=876091 RepID=UPI0025D8E901|nr:N-acetyl-gamma-glutamyl-phosphate reductase [uncultured Oscillibacter sp.]